MPNPTSRTDTTTKTMTRKSRRTVADKRGASPVTRLAPPPPSTDADVARRAYLIYLEEGCPQGRHLEHWVRAESELRHHA